MAYGKDIERVARAFLAQKLEPDYIRHYLMETYQLDDRVVDQLFEKLGIGTRTGPRGGGAPDKGPKDKDKIKRQGFY